MRTRRVYRTAAVVAALLVIAIVARWAHESTMPRETCTACHSPAILQPIVMGEDDNRFTGPDACEPCHTRTYHIWTKSPHCRAMMCPGTTTVFSHFSPDTVEYTYKGFSTGMVSGTDGYAMMAPGPDGKLRRYKIDLVVGIRDQQSFLTKFPDGRYQVLPSGYDMSHQTWYDATEGLIPSEHILRPDEPYYWANRGRTWNRECFPCHLSGMEKNYNADTDTYDTKWRDLGIDCEACHGPGREHARLRTVRFWRKGKYSGDHSLLRLQDLTPRQQVEVCAHCHARKAVLATGYEPGKDFYSYYDLALLGDNLVMPDGRFWGLMYDVLALMQSRCYEKGGITCTHCHDPHGSSRRNDIRDSFQGNDDRMCLPCHADLVRDPKPHTFHKADGPGSRCRNCHLEFLPVTRMNMADHTLSIPTPENTIRFGIPNACNRSECHKDSTAESMVRWLNTWYGPARRDRWTRAEVLFRAKALDASAIAPLMRMVGDTAENIIWRANAADMLGGFGDPRAVAPLLRHLRDPDPLLRFNAVYALAKFDDPRVIAAFERAILTETNPLLRQEMAGRLGWWWRDDLDERGKAIAAETWAAYVLRTNDALGDWPGARVDLGSAYAQRGEYPAAEREFTIALRLDPKHARAEDAIADLYARMERLPDALAHGRKAVELEPDDPTYRVNLAVTMLALGATADAERELNRALAIEPAMNIARKNLAMSFENRGRSADANRILREAIAIDPADGHAQYMYGVSCQNLGKRAEAAQAFVDLLAIAPAAPVVDEVRERLAFLVPPGTPAPRPSARRTAPRYRPPKAIALDPRRTWPAQSWADHTPRATVAEVRRYAAPRTLAAALDSAQKWLGKADQKFHPPEARRAFVERTIAELRRFRREALADPARRSDFQRLAGHAYAIRSSNVVPAARARTLELAEHAIGAADTSRTLAPAEREKVGRSWYRLARAYNERKDYRRAIPAFTTAARLVPDSFTEAISWFFIATSHDRLGERDLAKAAYARSDANRNNSVRGYRCAKHAQIYPFRYFPD